MTLLASHRSGFRLRADFAFNEPVRQIFSIALPVFAGASLSQINTMVDRSLASGLPEGRVAALNYGSLLSHLIITLTISIISAIIYPKMTRAINSGNTEAFSLTAMRSINVALIIGIPFSLGVTLFADPVVQVVYERGAFNTASTELTSSAFLFYGIGIAFSALNSILIQVFYSLKDTKTPMLASVISIGVNIGLNLVLIRPLEHRGLALATSCAALVGSIMNVSLFRRKYPTYSIFPTVRKLASVLLSAILAVTTAALLYRVVQLVWMPRMCYLAIAMLGAVAVYLAMLKLFRIEETKILKTIFQKRPTQ